MKKIDRFDFSEGYLLSNKYEVVQRLGGGWEGEVYIVRELLTGIERAAKFFYPHRNKGNRTLKFYAKKLYKLRNCSALIQYLTQETVEFEGYTIHYLISEYVEGMTLDEFLKQFRGNRLGPFQALHLLYALAQSLEGIHAQKEYHGDLHGSNIIVRRYGLSFDLKLIDVFHWGAASQENMKGDICDSIRVFYDVLGGAKTYPKHSPVVKGIVCGLKRSLILKKFRTSTHLKSYIEKLQWEDG